jgi:hypothetical protein
MTKHPAVLAGLVLAAVVPNAAASGPLERIATLPWGAGVGNVGLATVPDGRYGPQDLAFGRTGSVWILDTQNLRALSLGDPTTPLPVQPGAVLLDVTDRGLATVSATGRVEAAFAEGVLTWTSGVSFPLSFALRAGAPAFGDRDATLLSDGSDARAVVERPGLASVLVMTPSGVDIGYSIEFPGLIETTPLGRTPAGALTAEVQAAPEGLDGPVERHAVFVAQNGAILSTLHVPMWKFAASRRDIRATPNGAVHIMLSDETGVEVWRWDGSAGASFPPGYFGERLTPDGGLAREDAHPPLPAPAEEVTRSEALAIAKSYDDHVWTASLKNITTTTCTDWCGKTKTIDPPDWVVEGENTRFPYCWGGFSSLDSFDQGLLSDKKAGDKQTRYGDGSSACGSSCAVGVDCSGFVSQCWKAGSHYGTSQMDQISTTISKSDLKPADALNNAGSHVRLYVTTRADGNWDMVESYAGSGYWGVGYTVRSPADNSSYDAIRYNLIKDDPVTPHDPPVITHVPVTSATPGRDIVIAASVTTSTGQVAAFNLRHRKSGDVDWTLVPFTDKGGFNFETVIAASAVTPGVIEYWMAVWDGENPPQNGRNRVTLPADAETAFHYFEIVVETPDAGAPDTGPRDAGTKDQGTADDTGTDTGLADAGTPDAGTDGGTRDDGTADDAGAAAVLCGQYQIVLGYQDRPCMDEGETCNRLSAVCDGAVKPVCTCRSGVWDCVTPECPACAEGGLRCAVPATVEICSGGKWHVSVECGAGTACVEGRCIAAELDAGAPPGARPSLSDPNEEPGGCSCASVTRL